MTISTIIWDRRAADYDSLAISVISLERELVRLKEKMAMEGMLGDYSINCDLLRHAQRAHTASRSLYTLKCMQPYEDALNRLVLDNDEEALTHGTYGTIPFISGSFNKDKPDIDDDSDDDDFV